MTRLRSLLPIYLLIIVLLVISWRKWCEPVVDFGRELYVPWQLMLGKSLYTDVAYFNGPFSPQFNAIIFRVFGDSLLSLAMVNAVLLAGMLSILHSILKKIADGTLATLICLCLVPLMCIAQPGPMGNYNFITPYSHEMTHGLLLSLIAIWCLMRVRLGWDVVAGLCAGLTILTKPEIAIAACGAVLAGASLTRNPLAGFRIVVAMLLPPTIAFVLFKGNAFIAFAHLFDSRLTLLPFYRLTMGTYEVASSLLGIGIWSIAWIAFLFLGETVAASLDRTKRLLLLVILIVAAILTRDMVNWRNAALPLLLLNAWALVHAYRTKQPDRFTFCIFAMLLLGKIAFNVTLSNYGFALALPAVCVMVCFLGSWQAHFRVQTVPALRWTAIAMLCIVTSVYFTLSIRQWNARTLAMGTGADRFLIAPERNSSLDMFEAVQSLPSNASIAVVPQGAMLNYLGRRENSTGFIVIMPPEVLMFGEDKISAAFIRNPPEYVLIAKCDLSEYGYRSLTEYAPQLATMIDANYTGKSHGEGWVLLSRRSF